MSPDNANKEMAIVEREVETITIDANSKDRRSYTGLVVAIAVIIIPFLLVGGWHWFSGMNVGNGSPMTIVPTPSASTNSGQYGR